MSSIQEKIERARRIADGYYADGWDDGRQALGAVGDILDILEEIVKALPAASQRELFLGD